MTVDIYDQMIDCDEVWYVHEDGGAFLINDSALLDC